MLYYYCVLCIVMQYLAERRQTITEFLDCAMATFLPIEYAERSRIYDEDMRQLASSNNVSIYCSPYLAIYLSISHFSLLLCSSIISLFIVLDFLFLLKSFNQSINQRSINSSQIPIFICTMAYPTVRCPLHVFEPRYRLMIRRCMETGSRQFGMCAYAPDQPHGFAQYGTMLEVRDVEFFPDGRSVVDTVGGRRFRVLNRGVLDGYCTASVEWLVDEPLVLPSAASSPGPAAIEQLHNRVRRDALTWIQSEAPSALRQRIVQHFGSMPALETDWMTQQQPNGPSWLWWLMAILPLDPKAQVFLSLEYFHFFLSLNIHHDLHSMRRWRFFQ